MKHILCLILLFCTSPVLVAGQTSLYQHGTVVRMHMGDCISQHGIRAALSGNPSPQGTELCPEYTLVTDKVVYLIVGKMSNQLIPLAEIIDFRLNKNELAVRVDDARQETRFLIKEMALRSEWESNRQHALDARSTRVRAHPDAPIALNDVQ